MALSDSQIRATDAKIRSIFSDEYADSCRRANDDSADLTYCDIRRAFEHLRANPSLTVPWGEWVAATWRQLDAL